MHLQGNPLDYFIVFWAGVLVSFTPCVYPLLPITASIIAGLNTKGARGQGFLLSLIYVLGIAVTYSALAGVAALQGKTFGVLQNNPYTFLLMAVLLIVFSLVLLEVIPFPIVGTGLRNKIRPRSIGTLFLLGVASGFVIGPCTAPILGTLLLYVASQKNILHAMSLLFVFAYGVGGSLILAGTFSGFLAHLPKSGKWLRGVNQICAGVLLIFALVFLLKAKSLL